ncbi:MULTISPECIES: alpha/beta family hydrolase [unclassified Nocardioides]|uniref:alpha/beta hydrolase family protein n=1 Tax=unclassified Nocardioides TaxID=2615069 RepID=UPI0006F7E6FA|nr:MULTISPECIES: alpha/beta family hydrolase [unclassified Nocardioides]KQY54470.1 hydrolase [Nocardioides sp. Root140]KQZ66346.1 hydrolase [Nocardioides sp. Root151]
MVNVEKMLPTPYGDARLVSSRSRRPVATLLLSHGAGAGIDTPDLEALAKALPGQGITVHRLEQPWKVAGKKVATAPPTLDVALKLAADHLRPRTPLILGGRSAGARSAARSSRALGASGVLALSFPLHPPGRPEKSRVDELLGVKVPLLVVQGARDPMGRPEEFPAGTELLEVPYADHSLRVGKAAPLSGDDVTAMIVEATLEWIVREVTGR